MRANNTFLIDVLLFSICLAKVLASKSILVLGGNGFLGSETVDMLIDNGYKVSILNRGNEYYDSKTRIEPFVRHHYICDRDTYIRKTCKELLHSERFDVVIDFSAYSEFQVEQMIDILKGKIGLYILISTDSVYEVCEKSHKEPSRESDSNIPYDAAFKRKHKISNRYAEQKLECENVLIKQEKSNGFPYIILRLSEAIGPRDTTMRLWMYQLWLKLHKELKIPVFLPEGFKSLPFSLVYSKDVAKLITDVILEPNSISNKTYNLAFSEHIDLSTLLNIMANLTDGDAPNFNYSNSAGWFKLLTVDKGPVDISRARMALKWRPTSLDEALLTTLSFNEDAMVDIKFAKEREIMLASFAEDVLLPLDFEDEDKYVEALRNVYGESVFDGIDIGFDVDISQPRISSQRVPGEAEKSLTVNPKEETDKFCYKGNCPKA